MLILICFILYTEIYMYIHQKGTPFSTNMTSKQKVPVSKIWQDVTKHTKLAAWSHSSPPNALQKLQVLSLFRFPTTYKFYYKFYMISMLLNMKDLSCVTKFFPWSLNFNFCHRQHISLCAKCFEIALNSSYSKQV